MVCFLQKESGKNRKLSRPWHVPYQVISRDDPDVIVVRVYTPQDGPIQVHQTRITPCLPQLPVGFFWYRTGMHSPGRPPRWLLNLGKDLGPPDRYPQTAVETETSEVEEQTDSSDEEGDPAAVSKPKQSSLSDGAEESDATGQDGESARGACSCKHTRLRCLCVNVKFAYLCYGRFGGRRRELVDTGRDVTLILCGSL